MVDQTWLVANSCPKESLHGWTWVRRCCQVQKWSVPACHGMLWGPDGSFWRSGDEMGWASPASGGEEDHSTVLRWVLFPCEWWSKQPLVSWNCAILAVELNWLLAINRLYNREQPLRKKGCGCLIHVSDFINEEDGQLVLRDSEGNIIQDARRIIYPGFNGDLW